MRVAIAGYGIEGRQNFAYWNTPDNDVVIVDERQHIDDLPDGAQAILGSGAFTKLQEFDLVVRTAGLAPGKIITNGKVWSATNEFFLQCPAPIIGITGTKGKGTTSSLITSILRAAGRTVHLVGNIGIPALEVLSHIQPDDIVVYELSSFQLWDMEKSPHVSVVLMIEPDHLDVHDSLSDYVQAKARIARTQTETDVIIFNEQNEISTWIANQSKAQKIPYPFSLNERVRSSLKIPGLHNEENASAAIAAVRDYVQDEATIVEGLGNFTGLPHRLKFIREVRGVLFYDDSIATTPGSAIAAINSFDRPKILLLGGSDKGASYSDVVAHCKTTNTVVVAIGQTGEKIAKLCEDQGVKVVREIGGMQEVVSTAVELSTPGSVIILSPASASFDMFANYGDRGDQFIAAVERL